MNLGYLIMRVFGKDDGGAIYDPPNHETIYKWYPYPDQEPETYYCAVLNSEAPSDQVWLGAGNQWYKFYTGPEFRRMALWVLWRWIWGDWCGLKTKLWLIGLRRS